MSNQQKKEFTSNDVGKNMCEHEHLIIPEGYTAIDDFKILNGHDVPWNRVSLPASMTDIDGSSGYFHLYHNLKDIIVDAANPVYCDLNGVLFSKDRTALLRYPPGKTQSEYIIPDSVTTIAGYAFFNCETLEYVALPARLTHIGQSAFGSCSGLTRIDIPASVNFIGKYAFAGCSGFTRMDIPAGVNFIGTYALGACTALTQITAEDDNPMYTSLDGVLYNKNKTAVIKYPPAKTQSLYVISSGVTHIQDWAFRDCKHLTEVIIPDSTKNIGHFAFEDCVNLKDVTLPDGLVIIGNCAFRDCALTSVNIPDSVLLIGDGAFSGCPNLLNMIITSENIEIDCSNFWDYNPDMLITCAEGSPAHGYAMENGIKFEFIQNN